jgi:hypothetical protein
MEGPSAELLAAAWKARFHLQVALTWSTVRLPPVFTPCRGTVLRVFRGEEALRPGNGVDFLLPLLDRSKTIPPPADGSAWFHVDDFRSAPVVEIFLDGVLPELKLVGNGHLCRPLVAPTDRPVTPRPTEEEVRDAFARKYGTAKTLYFRDAQVESVVRNLAASGARLVSAERYRQEWILEGGGGQSLRLSLVEDYPMLLEELAQDPETYLFPMERELAHARDELGCEPRVSIYLRWYPAMDEVARRLVDGLLGAYPGVVRDRSYRPERSEKGES